MHHDFPTAADYARETAGLAEAEVKKLKARVEVLERLLGVPPAPVCSCPKHPIGLLSLMDYDRRVAAQAARKACPIHGYFVAGGGDKS